MSKKTITKPLWRDSHDYLMCYVGPRHPLADCRGGIRVHKLIYYSAGKPRLKKGEVLHHVNGNIDDMRLSNIKKITRSKHSQIHAATQPRDGRGRFGRKRK